MGKSVKRWFSYIVMAAMIMTNISINVFAADFIDEAEVTIEEESDDTANEIESEIIEFTTEEQENEEISDITFSEENKVSGAFTDGETEYLDEDNVDIRQAWDESFQMESDGGIDILTGRAGGMKTGERGYSLIKQFESCRLTAYKALPTEKYYTIGWGHYGADVSAGMTITQEQADKYLEQDVAKTERSVNNFLSSNGITISQNQFDALVSFTYNLGNVWVSTDTFQLKTILKNGYQNYSEGQIRTAFTNWNKSGGQVIAGLTRRRNAEADLFLSSVTPNPEPIINSPFGCLDTVTAEEGRITVSGWAADMDEPNQPIEVHVYAVQNGERVGLGTTTANIERPDICNNYPGINAYHGFRATFITNLSGNFEVEAYGINVGSTGGNSMLSGAPMTVSVPKDTTPPSISNIEIVDLSASGYTVTCDVSDNVAISKVQFPTWTENGGQDDLIWHQGTVSGNKASCRIEVSDHNNETNCEYITHIYADDLAGNSGWGFIKAYPENEPPVISNVNITDLSASGFTVNCDVTDNTGISRVQFATWTANGGQDDLIWHQGTVSGNKASCRINVSDHNNEKNCVYIVHIYADDISGNSSLYPTSAYVDAAGPVISDVEITDISEKGYTVKCTVADDHSGINRVQFPTWFADQNPYVSDGRWKTDPAVSGTLEDGKYIYRVNTSDFDNQIGLYNTHIYAWDSCGNQSENHPVQVTIKKAHNHEYVSSVKKAPTCIEPGIKLYTCKDGDDSYEEEIPATGHRNTELREKKEASCTEEGYTGDTYCKDCGTKLESGSVIAKTEHKWNEGKIIQNPTCVEDGEKTYTCTTCQKTRIESIAKTGHTEVKDAAIAATCESEGKTEGSHCSVCNAVIKAQESVPAIGHIWDKGEVVKVATCTEAGEKVYTCINCHKTRTESIARTDHTEVKDAAVVATCENTGKTEGSHCSVCNTVIKKQETLPALGHTWDSGKVTKAATCTTDGEKTYTCTTCHKTRTESIPKTGHTEVKDAATPATCENTGKTEGSHCSICGTVLKKQETLPALGHTWDSGKVTKAATCTTDGEETYTCTTCHKTRTESVSKTGHTEVKDAATPATCENTGKTEGSHCSICGTVIKQQETIPATGHAWDNGKSTKQASCTENGEKVYTCTTCQKTRTETIPATGHIEITKFAKKATCETEGYTGDIYCNNCGEMLKEGKVIEKLSHNWKQTGTKKATCTAGGENTYTCTRCNKTKTEQIPATGHKWSAWWKLSDATVFKPQKQQRTCSLCHTSQTRDYGSKLKSVMRTSCSSLLLKTKQTTNVLTVSGMAKGDYVSRVISGNTGIVRVTRYTKDGKIQLTAQGRTGNTSITIQLAGGAVKRINVKVQSGTVKTTAIRVSFTKATLKAGTKKTISTTVTPSTSQEKVTYTTSNKNIATVTANGIITARKRGTAKITVKSGSKKQIITVTVK